MNLSHYSSSLFIERKDASDAVASDAFASDGVASDADAYDSPF